MTDLLLRLVQSARREPTSLRADLPAAGSARLGAGSPHDLVSGLEIDTEVDAEIDTAIRAGVDARVPTWTGSAVGTPTAAHPSRVPPIAPAPPQIRAMQPAAPRTGLAPASPLPPRTAGRPDTLRPTGVTAAPGSDAPHASPVRARPDHHVAIAPAERAATSGHRAPQPTTTSAPRDEAFLSRGRGPGEVRSPPPLPQPALRASAADRQVEPAEHVVHISIGHIEVRSAPAPTPPSTPVAVALARPRQSLDDHLAARDRRRR